jgi:hypothetical protein
VEQAALLLLVKLQKPQSRTVDHVLIQNGGNAHDKLERSKLFLGGDTLRCDLKLPVEWREVKEGRSKTLTVFWCVGWRNTYLDTQSAPTWKPLCLVPF